MELRIEIEFFFKMEITLLETSMLTTTPLRHSS